MKFSIKYVILATAALLCLSPELRAQSLSVTPTSLSWGAQNLFEQAIYIGTEEEWEITDYGPYFVLDQTEGIGSDFIHVAPVSENTGTTDRYTTMYVRPLTGNSPAVGVDLIQYAPQGGGGGGGNDPTERIPLAGNWILSRTYTNAAGTASYEDITFYDGLGYPEQIVQVGASPAAGNKNIVTPVWYDSMRRADARSYLPFVSAGSTRAEESTSTVLSSQASWYNANGYSGQGAYAFSEQEYEASPLDRVLKVRKPGSTYAKTVSGSKYVQLSYGANAASEVRKLSVDASGQLVLSGGYYGAGTLHKTSTADEDDCVSVVWTDNLGRTVLTRQASASGVNIDTHYVYDDAGHLCWVVTPEGSAVLGTTGVWALGSESDVNTSNAAKYCYHYTWDARGRQLSRKVPGKAVEYFVYDRAGRPVMSQDGLQRAAGKWVTCKYDAQGRLVRRALLSSSQGRAYFQGLFESSNSPSAVYPSSGDTLLDACDYGTYTHAGTPSGLTFSAVTGIVAATDVDLTRITGLKTYEKVAVLSGTGVPSTYVERAFYYDALGRLVQTVEKNAMGTTSRYSSKYDFNGNVTASREEHGSDYKASSFTYDTRGRLLSESTGVNGGATATMAYAYDSLGRLKATTSGSGTGAVTTTDTFNIQGWLASRTALKGTANVFSMSLGYYSPVQSGAAARYSGDISSWAWTQGSNAAKAYAFTYDGAHRLTDGQYYSGGSATNALSEKGICYDRAGNITALTRYNSSGTATTLSYSYVGNRLSNIGSASYTYDVDGNLATDGRRGLALTYNLLGQTAAVTANPGGTAKAVYSYLSDGTKAGVVNGSDGFWYLGSFTYTRSNALESVAFGGGRIRKTGSSSYAVDYYITDHLGSVRAIINAGGTIVEQNDYYPFGTRHPNGLTTLSANRWRYNGKEDQVTGSLGYIDYGARFYDPDIARWNTMDPLAERYLPFSLYSYCGGNPIRFSDFEGLDWRDKIVGGIIGAATNIVPGSSPIRDFYAPNDASDYNQALRIADNVAFAIGGAAIVGGEFGVGAGTSVALAGAATASTIVAAPEGAAAVAGGALTIAGSEALKGAGVMLMANSASNKAGGYERGKSASKEETKGDKSVTFTQGKYNTSRRVTTTIPDGYKKTKYKSHGQSVFSNGKDFISSDKDGHNGGIWKRAKTIKELNSKQTRMGTYNEDLQWVGE